jgi:hypothetical protein
MDTQHLMKLTDSVPKVIDPTTHAVLDYLTVGGFLALGFATLGRNKRAATLAFLNSAAVFGLSLFTDYPGGVWRKISFATHGVVDAIQAGMAGAGPALMGFDGEPEAQFFHGQAALEGGIIAATRWESLDAAVA